MTTKIEVIDKFGNWEAFKKLVEKLDNSISNIKPSDIADKLDVDYDTVFDALDEINWEREQKYFELTGDLF